jgi:hypothetical protein
MILIGLISAIWIAVSLLVVGVCLAARLGDQDQQQNTSFAAPAPDLHAARLHPRAGALPGGPRSTRGASSARS